MLQSRPLWNPAAEARNSDLIKDKFDQNKSLAWRRSYMLKASSEIGQKQFYWTLVTKTVVQSFFFLLCHIPEAKESTVSMIEVHFLLSNCAITQFQNIKLYQLTLTPKQLYVRFEVSIFCINLHGVGQCLLPQITQCGAKQVNYCHAAFESTEKELAVIFIVSTGFKNKELNKLRGFQPFLCLSFCLFFFFIWKMWL